VGDGGVSTASVAQLEIGWSVPSRGESLQMRFERFHREHPEVYKELVRLARQKLAARARKGRQLHIGIGNLVEAVRWHEDDDDAPVLPQINNSYRSRYARLMAEQEPDLRDVFEMRELNA
jgi:hypothetical protein